jgi:hypothetical protein
MLGFKAVDIARAILDGTEMVHNDAKAGEVRLQSELSLAE